MRTIVCIATGLVLVGCVTLSGTYTVMARDSGTGKAIPGPRITAEGSRVYTARNALCINNPKAEIVIADATTGKELGGESPYRCP